VPTKHSRISIVRDADLDEALDRAERVLGRGHAATRVHDLAIRGADAIVEEHAQRSEAFERLLARMRRPGWMNMTPEQIDREAWGLEDA
jgi:citrate synthase